MNENFLHFHGDPVSWKLSVSLKCWLWNLPQFLLQWFIEGRENVCGISWRFLEQPWSPWDPNCCFRQLVPLDMYGRILSFHQITLFSFYPFPSFVNIVPGVGPTVGPRGRGGARVAAPPQCSPESPRKACGWCVETSSQAPPHHLGFSHVCPHLEPDWLHTRLSRHSALLRSPLPLSHCSWFPLSWAEPAELPAPGNPSSPSGLPWSCDWVCTASGLIVTHSVLPQRPRCA